MLSIKLKRKPSQQSDITTSLSAMSLDTESILRPWGIAGPNGSRQKSPNRKNINDASVPGDTSACLKKVKVKEADEELI